MGLILVMALAACGDDSSSSSSSSTSGGGGSTTASSDSDKEVNVGLFVLATANGYSAKDIVGAQKAVDEDGNASLRVFDGQFKPDVQFKQLQDATTTGQLNAFVVMPNDGNVVAPAVKAASGKGIKTVAAYGAIGPDPESGQPQVDGVVGTVWTPTNYYGAKIGETTVAACKELNVDPCKVAYMSGGLSIPFEKARLPYFEKELAKSTDPKIELVAVGEGLGFLQAPAIKSAQDILQAHPDINVFASIADQMTSGIEKVVNQAGKKDQIKLVSVGATKEGIQAVRDHRWLNTLPALPIEEGYYATKMAIDAARGKAPAEPEILLYEKSPVPEIFDWKAAEEYPDFVGEWSG